jgi:threonine efflux protein
MLTTLATIALLHWAALVIPGPNVLLVAQLAASGQRRIAFFAALGICVVALLWAVLAILGVNAVFVAHPQLRFGLQALGGAYLCYVAWRVWNSGGAAASEPPKLPTAFAALRLGFLTNILNPKSALFFGSVFATAVPQSASPTLLVSAVALVLFNALVWHVLLAVGFAHPSVSAAYARQRQALTRTAAVVLSVMGLRLLIGAALEARTH